MVVYCLLCEGNVICNIGNMVTYQDHAHTITLQTKGHIITLFFNIKLNEHFMFPSNQVPCNSQCLRRVFSGLLLTLCQMSYIPQYDDWLRKVMEMSIVLKRPYASFMTAILMKDSGPNHSILILVFRTHEITRTIMLLYPFFLPASLSYYVQYI